jgi:hypothetical protein
LRKKLSACFAKYDKLQRYLQEKNSLAARDFKFGIQPDNESEREAGIIFYLNNMPPLGTLGTKQ